MPSSFRLLFLFCCFALLAASCKSTKNTASGVVLKKKSARYIAKKMKRNIVDVEWLTAKARINYRDEEQSMKVSTSIRLRKDSILWMNFKKLSIEGARVLITPDSIYLMDRIHKEYAIFGFDYLERRFNMPTVIDEETGEAASGFQSLQALLLGNAPAFPDKSYSAKVNEQEYQLEKNFSGFDIQYGINGLLFTLANMAFYDRGFDRTLNVEQGDYKSVGNTENFSYVRNLKLKGQETGEISIKVKFSRVELNSPKSIRFEIPSHYKKI